ASVSGNRGLERLECLAGGRSIPVAAVTAALAATAIAVAATATATVSAIAALAAASLATVTALAAAAAATAITAVAPAAAPAFTAPAAAETTRAGLAGLGRVNAQGAPPQFLAIHGIRRFLGTGGVGKGHEAKPP